MRVLLVSLLAVVACDKGAKAPPAPAVIVAVKSAQPLSLADPLALLPADSDIVMKLDLAVLRKSPLWPKLRPSLHELITPGFVDCGYDPLDQVATVSVGIPMSSTMGVFVMRGIDRDKTVACLKTSKVETKTATTFDGDFITFTNKSGKVNIAKFVDATTMVMQGSEQPTKDTLTRALATGAPLRNDKDFVAAEATLKQGAVVSMIARPGSKRFSDALEAKLGVPSRGLTATVHATDIVSGTFRVELVDAATAIQLAENVKPQLGEIRQFVERYDVRADGASLVFDVAVTEAQIRAFADMAKAMMPDR